MTGGVTPRLDEIVDDYGLGILGIDLSDNFMDERDITERMEDLRHVRGPQC